MGGTEKQPTPTVEDLKNQTEAGLTTENIKNAKETLKDGTASRQEFLNYLKDAKNQTKLKECVGPSLQNILNDPTADKETKDAAQKLMVDLGMAGVEANKNTNTPDKKNNNEGEKKAPVITDANAQNIKTNIEGDPQLAKDPQKAEVFNNLNEALKKGDPVAITVALKNAWEYVKNILFSKNALDGKTQLGFTDFAKVQDQIRDILTKKPTKAELEKTINDLRSLATYETNTKKKLGYVYGESRLGDQISLQDKPEQSTYDLLAGKLHVGDVILLNKQDPGIGGKLLNNLSANDVDATHSIVITNESPLQFSHATMALEKGGSGVECNVNLKDYLKKYPTDAIVLETSAEMKKNAQKYIESKTGEADMKNAQYDYLAAAGSVMNPTEAAKANKYNCVQYVSRVLGLTNVNYTKPNDFLQMTNDVMQPSYMTTLINEQSFTSHDLMNQLNTPKPTAQTTPQTTSTTNTGEKKA